MSDESRDRRISGVLGVALFAYYLLTLGGHHYSVDGIIIFQSAKQLLFQHSLVLVPPVRWGTDQHVSIYGIGMTLAYIPLLAIWWPLFDRVPGLTAIPHDPSLARNPALYANLPYLLCSVLNPLITAATGCLVFRVGRFLGLSPAWSLVAAATYGLASPAAAYARYDFSQPLAGLAITGAAWGLLAAQRGGALATWGVSGTCLGCGLLTRPEVLAMAPGVAAWVWLRNRNQGPRAVTIRIAAVLVPVAVAVAAYIWISQLKFGALGKLGYAPTRLFTGSPTHVLEGLAGLLISPTRGLLVFFPLAALAAPGLCRLSRLCPGAASLFAAFLGASLVVYGSFTFWWGGWAWGPRLLVPLLPMITLAATAWAAGTNASAWRARTVSFALLAVLGFLISWNGILFDFVEHHRWVVKTVGSLATGADYFRLAASPLVTGWFNPPARSLDLFWLRLLDVDQVQAYRGLLGPAGAGPGVGLTTYASLAGALGPLVLLAVFSAAVHRLWTLLHQTPSAHPSASDEAFWTGVSTTFPSLKGAPSTAYYFECERGLLERFFPRLAGQSLLKTDLWDEAKNTEILKWAAEQGARPFGIDVAFDTVSTAKAVLAPHRPGCVAADVRALPFASNSLDLIYSMGTIEHSSHYEIAARELLRVLKPGGVAIIGVPNKLDPFLRPLLVHLLNRFGLYAYGFEKSFTPRELRRLLEKVGFRVTAQTGILFVPGWLRMMDLWCHARASRLVGLTALLIRPFAWLYRTVPAVRRHGYLTVCVVVKVRQPA